MNEKIKSILEGKGENHIFPFFWQHGEDETTLREYMEVIDNCHIKAVCVESRPHPDFAGPKWWRDMDIILDEARKRNMKVWILDDSHFPTGYANGAAENAPAALKRRNICYQGIAVTGRKTRIHVNRFLRRRERKESILDKLAKGKRKKISAPPDELLSISAIRLDKKAEPVDLTGRVKNGILEWNVPEGNWKIGMCKLSYRCGMHDYYINMMDEKSVRLLVDAVYEPHYAHYKEDFGNTIAGFFSDEPELGNGPLYKTGKMLGTPVEEPWSDTLIPLLEHSLGENWKNRLPLLWENVCDADDTAHVRYAYMDAVTRRVQKAFSEQLGNWCRARGVQYIGHVIEDDNQHCRTGSSLGHYFRALSGQDMAGIDDIGVQVYPQGEDGPDKYYHFMPRDGEFFHYVLGKMASSLAAVDEKKCGNSMCEIFGNYGWSEGFRLEKYLADHFMVRGVNHYVPHAFNAKAYPDIDCPPHFYAHGHNPQYRHFSALMDYMNRVCNLISNGRHEAPAALLYYGEAEWTGDCMKMQKPARKMYDRQIDFDIIPADAFADRETYRTDLTARFTINTQTYRCLVIPYAQYISSALAGAVEELQKLHIPVFFIQALPDGIYDGDRRLLEKLEGSRVVQLEELVAALDMADVPEIYLKPDNNRIRALHYIDGYELFYFVNEGTDTYYGTIMVPAAGKCAVYNAELNRMEQAKAVSNENGTELTVEIKTRQSLLVLFDDIRPDEVFVPLDDEIKQGQEIEWEKKWKRSICRSTDYPKFEDEKEVRLPDEVSKELPKFSGMIRYTNSFVLNDLTGRVLLEITDAYEGVEVFINGISAGIQIVPVYRFDLTDYVKPGKNRVVIEVSTTLERERRAGKESILELLQHQKIMQPTGITGKARLVWAAAERKSQENNM